MRLGQIQVEPVNIHLIAAQSYLEGPVGRKASERAPGIPGIEQGLKVNKDARLVGSG
jgi:hypothetical protein